MLFISSFLSLGSICWMQLLESLMAWNRDSISLRFAMAAVWRRLKVDKFNQRLVRETVGR